MQSGGSDRVVISMEKDWWKEFFSPDRYGPSLAAMPAESTEEEAEFALSALQLPAGAKILDLCCGTGRHTLEFARRGYRAAGLDYTQHYIDEAAARAADAGLDIDFIRADMRRIPKERRFDAVVNLFSSFGYFESDTENFKVFAAVARALKKGGRFMIEQLNRDWMVRYYEERRWSEDESGITLEECHFDAATDTVHTIWTWIRGGDTARFESRIKLYPFTTMKRELERRGLVVESSYGDYDGSGFSFDSGRMIIVAVKK